VIMQVVLSGCGKLPDENSNKNPVVNVVSGNSATQSDAETKMLLPFDEPIELALASGAGAWNSVIELNNDGTFEGEYYNSDATTIYVSDFKGKFGKFKKLDDNTYSMILENISTEKPIGEEWNGETEYDGKSITL